MPKDFKDITGSISKNLGEFGKAAPDAMKAFGQLSESATKEGRLDFKTKELIALAIGVTQRCEGCIGFHAKKVAAAGATREELAEMLAVCTFMGGGPALMYVAEAWEAFNQFSED